MISGFLHFGDLILVNITNNELTIDIKIKTKQNFKI